MWERCADRIVEMGGSVLLSHRVTSLEVADGKVTSVVVETPQGEKTIEGTHFLATMPLRSLVQAIDPPAPQPVRESAEGLGYRDFILVALVLDKDNLFPDNWIYVHTPGVLVGRVQNFGNWSEHMVPVPGRTCLGMEYFCFSGDDLWNKKDSELIALATEELARIGLARGANVVDGTVVRMPKAYPIYDSSYAENVERIRAHLAGISNLATLGRNGMHKYNNQDHSMYTAMLAVENMEGAQHDIWSVNTDYEYHEEQKVDRTPSGENWAAAR
jgi:protoporphyrinogen oxidase